MGDYKTYAMVDGRRFDDIEDAVAYIENSGADTAIVEIWDTTDCFVDDQKVTAENNYSYSAYAVFVCDDDGSQDWYNNTETFYNSEREAIEAISATDYGEYDIVSIEQTVSEKIEECVINHVSVKEDTFDVRYDYN